MTTIEVRLGPGSGGVVWRVLGPMEVRTGSDWARVGAPKVRGVLAALLAEPGRVVATGDFVDELWGERPPPGARKLVSGYVLRLRRLIADPAGQLLVTQAPGYRLMTSRADVDAYCFEDLLAAGRGALEGEDAERAYDLLTQALELWRGPALADVPRGPVAAAEAGRLDEMRLDAVQFRIEATIVCGRTAGLVAELRWLTARHPLREHFWHQLMRVLEHSGRGAEALATYVRAREVIAAELGADPGPDLQQLHQRLLGRGLPAGKPHPGAAAPQSRHVAAVPRQLPPAARYFAGRQAELTALDGLLAGAAGPAGTVMVSVIVGMAGVGKTALAVRWAHQVADRFPDGQLYVNLRGFGPSGLPMTPAEAIRGFLLALGVPGRDIPADPDGCVAAYRSLLAGQRMLVVLDNARDEQQARPLLPASPGCLVIVTSRCELSGLVAADGADPTTLHPLTGTDACALLAARVGAQRVAAEPQAAVELTRLGARLPLAMTITAARAAMRPDIPLAALADELRAAGPMTQPDTGDPAANVRAAFSWSYQNLDEDAATMFRLVGIHPGPDISAPAATSLVGLPAAQARQALGELTRAHLLHEHSPGRFSCHDLLRDYAVQQAAATDRPAQRRAAAHRVLDHYLHTAYAADRLLHPSREPLALAALQSGTLPEKPADLEAAMAWFDAEHKVLMAAIAHAASSGLSRHAWQLPWSLATFLDLRGHWEELIGTQCAALAAATSLKDERAQALVRDKLGFAYLLRGQHHDAAGHFEQALAQFRQLADKVSEARVHLNVSFLLERQSRYAAAARHDKRALHLFRAAGHRAGQALALNAAGWHLALLGKHQQALTCCQDALALQRELDDRLDEANTWDSLGYIHDRLGQHEQAAACYQEALHLLTRSKERWRQATILTHLGDTHHSAGNPQAARDAWRHALAIFEDMHHRDAEAVRGKLTVRI